MAEDEYTNNGSRKATRAQHNRDHKLLKLVTENGETPNRTCELTFAVQPETSGDVTSERQKSSRNASDSFVSNHRDAVATVIMDSSY